MTGPVIDLVAAVAATMLVALAPGWALLAATRAHLLVEPLLRPAAAVCASVLVVAPILVVTLALGWSLDRGGVLLALVTAVLVVVALLRWRPHRGERVGLRDRMRAAAAYVVPGALLVALGIADAPQVRSDTFWHVALARKLAELDSLSGAKIAFEAGSAGNANYPLPVWHAVLALADLIPRVDPWTAAWFVTLWLAPCAMLAFGGMVGALVGDRRATLVGCWTFVAIVVLGYGPWYFATRYLAYPGQVAIFLALPVVVVAVVAAIRSDGAARVGQLLVAGAGTVVIGLLHGNYVLYPALFAGGGAALLLLGRRERVGSALLATGAVVGAGAATLAAQLPWITRDDNFLRGSSDPAGEPSAFVRHRDVFVGSEQSFHVELGSLATQPWLVAGAIALPVLLLLARRRPGPWVLAGGAVAIVVFAWTPWIVELLDRAGSVTPVTRMDRIYPAAVGVAAIALGIAWLLERTFDRGRSFGIAACVAWFAALAAGTWWLDSIRDTRRVVVTPFVEARWVGGLDPSAVPRVAVIAATLAIVAVASWLRLRDRIATLDDHPPRAPGERRFIVATVMVVAIVVGLAPESLDRARATWQPDAYRRSARTDTTYTRIDVYPPAARRAAARLESGSVILGGFNDVRRVASLTPVQSVEESVLREISADPPTATEARDRLDSLVEEWDADYIVTTRFDRSFQTMLDAAAAQPARFEDRSAGTLRVFRVLDRDD